MTTVQVTFDAKKIGGAANPITVSPANLQVAAGARQTFRFTLRTLGSKSTAVFDTPPVVFNPGSPVCFDEPVPMESTSFSFTIENNNESPFPQRLYCTLWVRYEGQCYPALFPTIVNEPRRRAVAVETESRWASAFEHGAMAMAGAAA
jgi:hypothetical protein